jgi:ABC-type branched-subunit amino acid transport system ATPase component
MLAVGPRTDNAAKVLILDEPNLGLAPVILEQLSKALEKVQQSDSITVLLDEPRTTKPAPKHKIFRYLLAVLRSSGRTRSGARTSPVYPYRTPKEPRY